MGDAGREVVIARTPEDLSHLVATRITHYLMDLAKAKDRISVAMSGGTAHKKLYERLATGAFPQKVPWDHVHLFWGDERCVPPQHEESNYRMAHDTLISRVPIPAEHVYRMEGEQADHQRAADAYEATLHAFFGVPPTGWPRFDLVLLGVGQDGHTASLFPGTSALEESKRWVAAPYVETLKVHRLTLTLPVLNHAALVIVVVAGQGKAPIMKEVLASGDAVHLPAQRIRPHDGQAMWFLDASAASLLGASS